MRKARRVIAIILLIGAIAAIAVGVVYLTVPAHSLPSILPGHVHGGSTKKLWKKGTAGVVAGVVLFGLAVGVRLSGRRKRHWN
jgi:amino acid permease